MTWGDALGTGGSASAAAFPDVRDYPAYTTVEKVRVELPPRITAEDLSDDKIAFLIDTQANRLDAALLRYYDLPAPPLAAPGHTPATGETAYVPAELERVNRYLTVAEIMPGLFDGRQEDGKARSWWDDQAEAAIKALQEGEQFLAYPFRHPDGRPYFVPLAVGSPLYAKHPLSGGRRLRYSYPQRRFTGEDDPGGVLR